MGGVTATGTTRRHLARGTPRKAHGTDDAERVAKTAELVVAEATKAKPDKGFLSITTDGLKKAAEVVADIAPTVLTVAGKVAAFVAGLA